MSEAENAESRAVTEEKERIARARSAMEHNPPTEEFIKLLEVTESAYQARLKRQATRLDELLLVRNQLIAMVESVLDGTGLAVDARKELEKIKGQ